MSGADEPMDERLRVDRSQGAIRDGDIRYLMLRADVLMDMFARLPREQARQALAALGEAVYRYGGRSAATYAAEVGPERLLETITQTAPMRGWGAWEFSEPGPDGFELAVTGSPFVQPEIYGGEPVCAPIVGMLTAVAELAFDRPASARELSCTAETGQGPCRFEVRWRPE